MGVMLAAVSPRRYFAPVVSGPFFVAVLPVACMSVANSQAPSPPPPPTKIESLEYRARKRTRKKTGL